MASDDRPSGVALPAWSSPTHTNVEAFNAEQQERHPQDDVIMLVQDIEAPAVKDSFTSHAQSYYPPTEHTEPDRSEHSMAPSMTQSGPQSRTVSAYTGGGFGIDPEVLFAMNTDKDMESLHKFGGIDGIADSLQSDLDHGIEPRAVANGGSIENRKLLFGQNELPTPESASFFAIMWGNLQDPILILLMAAAAVSTALGAGLPEQRAKNEWIEGVAIWAAVFIVSGVGAANDYQKDKQFRKLNEQRDTFDIKVIRAGQKLLVCNKDIVVGDVIMLDAGDKVVADCLAYDCQGLSIDEAALTGESDAIKKGAETDPWVRSGTQVSEGSGKALVIAVGENSEWGKTMALMEEAGDDETPLQAKLGVVASTVGKFGFSVALAVFIAMMIMWMVKNKGFPIKQINDNGPVQFFLYAVTIIVVAIPEGLPLAVTISLAFSMKKMLQDQNFVRVLAACETMGGATAICSDKTGTLTENRMTVVEGWFAGKVHQSVPEVDDLPPNVVEVLKINMAVNSKAFLLEKEDTANARVSFVGSSTECALLMLLRVWGFDYNKLREQFARSLKKLHGFTSVRKMSSAVIKHKDHLRLYNKGAAEWVLRRCKYYMNGAQIQEITPEVMDSMMNVVTLMAKRGLRCICLSYRDFDLEDFDRPFDYFDDADEINKDLICVAIVGIKDPVRKEVPDAVATCQRAGITVRMVTGDNIHTAKHIARECGILTDDEHLSMEGPEFRKLHAENLAELQALLPSLRVLARSSPEDKLTLVKMLKAQDEVVAVTGDGTNDAPALRESNVGLAMGITGTEVAKEAADIIILDDNFTSIVKSVLWGRSVFNNIRKFLQFQLTVNCAALIICFIGAVAGGIEPLNVLQLLWVNLIMDTMGALALATEDPSPELLKQMPNGPNEPLINGKMWKHIIIQSLYQVFVQLICLFVLPLMVDRYKPRDEQQYFRDNCLATTSQHLGIPIGTGAYNNGTAPDATWYCNVMTYCGFPLNRAFANTNLCPVYRSPDPTPDAAVDAICFNAGNATGTSCAVYSKFDSALSQLYSQINDANDAAQIRSLSLLFNAFIWCQIFNEICARRINDEYDFFSGINKSPIFIGVIVITAGFQAIIMQFLGIFFKVVPLDYVEWFCCIAAGFGTCLVSWATRWMSRNMRVDMVEVIINLRGGGHHANRRSTRRSLSGRQYSGRTYTGRPDDFGSHRGNRSMKGSSMRGSASIKVVSLRGNSVHGSSARSNNKVLPT